jgi:aminopeptidase
MPIDLRTQKLAKLVVNRCLHVKENENVIISGSTEAEQFILALYKEIILKGAHPILRIGIQGTAPFFYKHAKKHQIEKFPDHFDYLVKTSHKYIGIDTEVNTRELTNCDSEKITQRQKIMQPISTYIVDSRPKLIRCTVGFPCLALAQEADMSLQEYENFIYNACLQDWNKISKFMLKLKNKFKENSNVHLIGENVDLKFRVHGKKAATDLDGDNMPMGEIFMAPVKESLNGYIKFEYPAIEAGKEVTDIELKFENGKVIEAKASKNEDFLKQMLNTDTNSSYIGEFGIGCNPKINKFTKNLLFDEKINGTIHLALGKAYKENTTKEEYEKRSSAIHWDIVKDMKKAKIIVDNKVIQENGKWKI